MRLLQDGPVQTWMTEEDGKTIFKRTQDCTPIVEHCHNLRAVGAVGSSEMRFAGKIPKAEVEKYMNDHGITFAEFIGNEEHVRRYLNNPDHKLLRVWTGAI